MSPARKAVAPDTAGAVATIRIELLGSDPLIWREVEVPTSITLTMLHAVIQAVMRWEDDHLWEFTIAKQKYSTSAARKLHLHDMLRPRRTTIDYLYDFGDCWEVRLTVADIRAGEPGISYPRYVAGECNAPPEDCGGIPGFYAMLEAAADPRHPEYDHCSDWLGDYDPKVIDAVAIRSDLAGIANRLEATST
jgi:hypothetical protein